MTKKSADLLITWWTALISEEALAIRCLEGFPDSEFHDFLLQKIGEQNTPRKRSDLVLKNLGVLVIILDSETPAEKCIWTPKIYL